MKNAWIPIAGLWLASGGAAKADLSTPEKAVRTFLAAVNAGDLRGAALAVNGLGTDSVSLELEREWKSLAGGVRFTMRDFRVQPGGTSASASFELTYLNPANGKSTTVPDRVHLRRAKNEWRILPGAADSLSSGSILTVSFLAVALADPKAWRTARGTAETIQCMANMRKVTGAALDFRRNNEGRLPGRASDFRSSVAKYLKPADIPRCPQDKSSGESYLMNVSLQGKRYNEITLAEDTVMVYEGKAQRLLFRHDRKAVVGMADGSVRLVTENQSRTLRWIP